MLPITEGAHWLLRHPIVVTIMSNVPPGERYGKRRNVSFKMPLFNVIRNDSLLLQECQKPSLSQEVLLHVIFQSNESYDK